MPELQCPQCETADDALEVVKVQEEFTRVTYALSLSVHDGYVNDWETDNGERELLEADSDSAVFRCEACGHEAADPDEFLAEVED